jgi:hypothetical protein
MRFLSTVQVAWRHCRHRHGEDSKDEQQRECNAQSSLLHTATPESLYLYSFKTEAEI